MFFLSKTHSGQGKEGRALFRNRIWLRILVLAGLGAMVLTVLCLLPGCGSDSTPGGSVKGENAKTAGLGAKKSVAVTPLLIDKDETGPGKMGTIKQQPKSNFVEPIPGVTQEKLEARAAADRKILESPDTEVFPGVTQAQLEARLAADKKSFDPKTAEVFPGMTQAQLEAQNAKQKVPDNRELVPPAVGK